MKSGRGESINGKIEKVTDSGIIINDRHITADIIVACTGWDTKKFGSGTPHHPIRGANETMLHSVLDTKGVAYKNHSMTGFPNLFCLQAMQGWTFRSTSFMECMHSNIYNVIDTIHSVCTTFKYIILFYNVCLRS